MNVYITKLNGMGGTTQYMQRMSANIAHQLGFREMGIYHFNANGEKLENLHVRIDGIIAGMQPGDVVVCQFHTWNGLRYERTLVEHIKAYHGRVVIFIHSLEALMIKGSRFMLGETIELYNQAEALIVPSYEMKKFLLDSSIRAGMKFIVQEMWDYTTEISFPREPEFRKEIYCTGGLDQETMDDWNYEIPLNLYSATAKGRNVHYMGGFKADESLMTLSEGGFGLEWYSDEYAYQYMRYGNSFPLSCYLAAGIPVIVPEGISCQKLIEENHLGIIASSLDEAVKIIESMSESEYKNYVQHIQKFAPALRNGYYTKKCLIDSVQALFREDMGKAFEQRKDIYEVGDYEFLSTSLKPSYGGNLALSWNLKGKPDGFLIYDTVGNLIDETESSYQHYMLIKGNKEAGLVVKAYVNTQKGKMIVAKSETVYPEEKSCGSPRVSIVIPAYNAQAGIVRSIDTVLAQTFADLEIVVVNDGSTDHTAEILDWYAHNYSNITVIHQENAGVQAARNAGILSAKGEYTGFVDSDDMVRPDMVERLYTSVIKNQCDVAITSGYQIGSRGYGSIMQYSVKENTALTAHEFLQTYASGGYAMPAVWNKLYRASLVKEHLFPPIRYEDEAWTPYVLSYADKICYRNDLSYEYDRSTCTGSLVDQWAGKSKEEVFQDHKKSILFYLENGNPERIEVLKKLAKSELGLFSRTTKYDGYKILLEQIEDRKKMEEKTK